MQVSPISPFRQLTPKVLIACYQVGHIIAKSKMLHTISEELILPAAIELVSTMKGKAPQHLKLVTLSNDLFENKCIFLPSNLQSMFLQHLSELKIFSELSRELIKL